MLLLAPTRQSLWIGIIKIWETAANCDGWIWSGGQKGQVCHIGKLTFITCSKMQTIDNCNYNQEQSGGWNNKGIGGWSQEDRGARQRRRPYHRSVAPVSTNQLVTIAMRRIIRLSSIVWFQRSFHHINCIVIAGREAMFKWTRQWATHHSLTSSWTT